MTEPNSFLIYYIVMHNSNCELLACIIEPLVIQVKTDFIRFIRYNSLFFPEYLV